MCSRPWFLYAQSMLLGKASVVLTGGAVFVTLNYQASKKVEQYYRDQVRVAVGRCCWAHIALMHVLDTTRSHSISQMDNRAAPRFTVCTMYCTPLASVHLPTGQPASGLAAVYILLHVVLQVYRTLERGFCPGLLAPEEELLPRRRLRERLMTILGQDSSKCYYLVTGDDPGN